MILNLLAAAVLCAALFFSLVWIMVVMGALVDTMAGRHSYVSEIQSAVPAFFWSVFYFLNLLR